MGADVVSRAGLALCPRLADLSTPATLWVTDRTGSPCPSAERPGPVRRHGVLALPRMRVWLATTLAPTLGAILGAILGPPLGLAGCGNSERAGAEEAQRQAEREQQARQAASP